MVCVLLAVWICSRRVSSRLRVVCLETPVPRAWRVLEPVTTELRLLNSTDTQKCQPHPQNFAA
jgi:hypothetical protein